MCLFVCWCFVCVLFVFFYVIVVVFSSFGVCWLVVALLFSLFGCCVCVVLLSVVCVGALLSSCVWVCCVLLFVWVAMSCASRSRLVLAALLRRDIAVPVWSLLSCLSVVCLDLMLFLLGCFL